MKITSLTYIILYNINIGLVSFWSMALDLVVKEVGSAAESHLSCL